MLYIILVLTGLLPAAWVIARRRDAALLATLVMAAAIVHSADWIASGVMGLYKYHPGLFFDPNLDDAAGVLLAELGFVSSLAVLLVALIPSWWGALIGSAAVTVLEIFFEQVGALEYRGWTLFLTSTGFIVYFVLVRWYWLAATQQGPTRGWLYTLTRVALSSICNGIFKILMWAAGATTWYVYLLPTKAENQALLRYLWHACVGAPLVYWIIAGKRPARPVRWLSATIISMSLNQIAEMLGFRSNQEPWNPVMQGLLQCAFFALAFLVDDRIRAWSGPRIPPWSPPS